MAITFSALPTATATVGTPYGPSSFVATGGTGPYTYAVTAGIVPPGMALSSAGALSGTPTSGNVYTFQVTATDSLAATGVVVFSLVVSGGTVPPVGNPVAAHAFDFVHAYVSTRNNAPPGQGAWTNPVTIFDGTFGGYPLLNLASTFSAGALTANPVSESRGIVSVDANFFLEYLGNGLPDVPVQMVFPGVPSTMNGFAIQQNYGTHYGSFTQGATKFTAVLQGPTGGPYVGPFVLQNSGGGWSNADAANAPPNTAGNPLALQRVDNYLYFFLAASASPTAFQIYPFNMATSKWEPAFAALTISDLLGFHDTDNWTNGLYKFVNGDFLVLYIATTGGNHPVARLWTAATNTWGAPQTLPGAAYAQSVMDPGLGIVHVFTYVTGFATTSVIKYSTFTHTGAVVTSSIATIPAATLGPSSDGANHPSIQNGMLFLPRDDQGDFANAVWVGLLPAPANFLKEYLPTPLGETNEINAWTIAAGGAGYAIGDTGTVNTGIAGYLAEYIVDGIGGGGVVTSINFSLFQGGGYSVANNVATTRAGTQPGSGNGALTINITQVTKKIPSCAYMMFPNGYSLGNPLPPGPPPPVFPPVPPPFNQPQGGILIYPVNYRELDTAAAIAAAAPIHTSFTGRLIATDHTRKWTRWNVPAVGAALMYRQPGKIEPIFYFGGNVYALRADLLTDDDLGLIVPYYTTYFFVTHDAEMGLTYVDATGERQPLGSGRKLLAYLKSYIAAQDAQTGGTCQIVITPFVDNLQNRWALIGLRTLVNKPKFDLEWPGGQAQGDRIALQFWSTPITGTDNGFSLQRLTAFLKRAQRLQIRGAN